MLFNVLSRYDDFLAWFFLDTLFLWFTTTRMNTNFQGTVPHQDQIVQIVRNDIVTNSFDTGIKKALANCLSDFPAKEMLDFKNHLRLYLAMFFPTAGFEITSTTRYTGKFEAAIVATKNWSPGDQVKCCSGTIAELNQDDDRRLKAEGLDFSVLFSSKKKCTCLFLGPARFMNHDCEANCSFMQTGPHTVSFKVNRSISCGEEMTVYYGDHYFGENNCECLCLSCERNGKGKFAKKKEDEEGPSASLRRSGRSKKAVDYKDYSVTALMKMNRVRNYPELAKKKPLKRLRKSSMPLEQDNASPSTPSTEAAVAGLQVAPSLPPSPPSAEAPTTCCGNLQQLPTVCLSDGQVCCAKCHRHFMVFGLLWPTRKQAPSRKVKGKAPAPRMPSGSPTTTTLLPSSPAVAVSSSSSSRKRKYQEAGGLPSNKKNKGTGYQHPFPPPYTHIPFQIIPVKRSLNTLPPIRSVLGDFL